MGVADLARKRAETEAFVAAERASGVEDEAIARKLVSKRNADRIATYAGNPAGLEHMKRRNRAQHAGREERPGYDYLVAKGKTTEAILFGSTKPNRSMDIRLGIVDPTAG